MTYHKLLSDWAVVILGVELLNICSAFYLKLNVDVEDKPKRQLDSYFNNLITRDHTSLRVKFYLTSFHLNLFSLLHSKL